MTRPVSVDAARTLLFVPGDRPGRFPKAARSGADGVILDLEDAVPPAGKRTAREHVCEWIGTTGNVSQSCVVRVNDRSTAWHDADVEMVGDSRCAVMLPKAESAEELRELAARLSPDQMIIPLIETAAGVINVVEIGSEPRVARLAFGNIDLAAQLGTDPADQTALLFARSRLVLAAAAAGLAPPLDGVTTAVDDPRLLARDTRHARSLGMTGKLCIHPRQVRVVHDILAVDPEEVSWARRILAGPGPEATRLVDGEMVDKPVLERARRIIARAGADHDDERDREDGAL
jgi:citrate lyase subunit beta/citryl-CoA lyase